MPKITGHGTLVGRQLHDQHRRLAFEQRFFEKRCRSPARNDPQDIHRKQNPPPIHGCPGNKPRSAAHNTGNRAEQPSAAPHFVASRSLGLSMVRAAMMPESRTKGTEHRISPAVQPGLAHQAIHQKRRPPTIARVFQKPDKKEKQTNLRQKHDDRADTLNNAVTTRFCNSPGGISVAVHPQTPKSRPESLSIGSRANVKIAMNIDPITATKITGPRTGASCNGRFLRHRDIAGRDSVVTSLRIWLTRA